MRISDWSSDVCSSDLIDRSEKCNGLRDVLRHAEPGQHAMLCQVLQGLLGRPGQGFLAQMDAWQNRVATDILLPVLRRDVFGKDVNATLRCGVGVRHQIAGRSEEHTSELQSLMRISYAVFCLKKKKQ